MRRSYIYPVLVMLLGALCVSPVQAADGEGDGPQKAVVVAGPVHA